MYRARTTFKQHHTTNSVLAWNDGFVAAEDVDTSSFTSLPSSNTFPDGYPSFHNFPHGVLQLLVTTAKRKSYSERKTWTLLPRRTPIKMEKDLKIGTWTREVLQNLKISTEPFPWKRYKKKPDSGSNKEAEKITSCSDHRCDGVSRLATTARAQER